MKKHNNLILGSFLMLSMLVGATACQGESPSSNQSSISSEQANENLGSKYPCITVEEAIAKATEAGENETSESFYLYGKIKQITNPNYGEMIIEDETGEIYVFGLNDINSMDTKPLAGDEIVIKGALKCHNGKPEFSRSDLIELRHIEVEVDDKDYVEMSISEARSKNPSEKVKLSGVVARITYGQKKVPNGFMLVDSTGSIYVHGSEIVQRVENGNQITIIGERTNYIDQKETSNANKFGYQGAIQINNAKIVTNDHQVHPFDNSWVREMTMKEIINTPLSHNITSEIFKVTAFITKDINPGYTNYYIKDLDRKTGSYVYTSSNGADFDWLDAFDNKLCTVYLTALNCKSTSSGCLYRFVPVDVEESSYQMTDSEVPNFIYEYYIKDQIKTLYNSDPNLSLTTSFSNEDWGYENATATYTSSDSNVLEIVTNENGTFLRTKNPGTATLTILIKHKNQEVTKTIDITYRDVDVSDAITVKEAITADDQTKVKVKGIVLSSLVNRTGFYLADESGVIAVTTTTDVLNEVKQGQMIYIEGIKKHHQKKPTTSSVGQIVIDDAKLVLNEYGNHDYPTSSFDATKTIEDLLHFDVLDDHTAQVYVVKGKIDFIVSQYSTNFNIVSTTDKSQSLQLYCSSGEKQYGWLKDFKDQEVTIELMLCNWNNAKNYKGCIVSVKSDTKKVINTLNFPKEA